MATKKIIIRDWSSFKHPLEINLIVWILSRCSYYLGATVYSRGNLISVVWCSFFVPSYVLSQCVYFADKACHCDLNSKMNIFIWHDDAAHSASFFFSHLLNGPRYNFNCRFYFIQFKWIVSDVCMCVHGAKNVLVCVTFFYLLKEHETAVWCSQIETHVPCIEVRTR